MTPERPRVDQREPDMYYSPAKWPKVAQSCAEGLSIEQRASYLTRVDLKYAKVAQHGPECPRISLSAPECPGVDQIGTTVVQSGPVWIRVA